MTEIQIPYLPSAKFFKVLCRLGVHEQDISSDTDSNPQIRTIGGTVTISASIGRFRYTEADGRSRVIYNKTETYNIQTSTGELFDVDGNLGVNLLDTTSPGIDPQGWTYKATVRPTGGEPFDVDIPASLEPGGTLDLGDGLVFTPSTGITSLENRVKALEDAGPSSGGPTAWNDITDKPSEFAPSEHRHDASEIDNLPFGGGAVSSVAGKTGDVSLSSEDLTDGSSLVDFSELASALSGKAASTHTHDDRYYTETESDGRYLQASTAQAINAQTGAAYTLVASDAGKLVTLTNAGAITLTVPGSVFAAGQRVDCLVAGAGMVTAVGSGATVNGTPSLVSRAQYSAFTVLFTSATNAVVVGDLA